MATYFAMTLGAFAFWKSMDRIHIWIAVHQDEKKERLAREIEIRRVREELLQQTKQKDVVRVRGELLEQTKQKVVLA